jgi:hypothetical protein
LKKPKGKDHIENPDVEGRIILKWILKKYGGMIWTVFIWLWIGSSLRLL